jgi:hypothetical protein
MIDIHKENIWVIGIHGERAAIFVMNKKLGNVPDSLLSGVYEPLGRPEQWYFKE